jgi:hypothetical protein
MNETIADFQLTIANFRMLETGKKLAIGNRQLAMIRGN